MKKLSKTIVISISTSVLVVSCSAPQSSDHMESDKNNVQQQMQTKMVDPLVAKRAVESILDSYAGQVTAMDVTAMEEYVLTEGLDFTIFEGKGTNIGWTDYRDHHLAPEFANEDLVFTKYEYRDYKTSVSGSLATATFTIDMAYTYKGDDIVMTKHGTAILKKVGENWKIAHLHTS